MLQMGWRTARLLRSLIRPGKLLANGESDFISNGWKVYRVDRDGGARRFFPPEVVVQVKAIACELPKESGIPLSRYSTSDLRQEMMRRGLVAEISGRTIWRWLDQDAIRPWYHRSWIFPRDPLFAEKAGRVLDLYQGCWEGTPLTENDEVISADEKTSIQARIRLHSTEPPKSGKPMKVEFEYGRGGALAYIAAWDVQRARVFGCCDKKTGIGPFSRLVEEVMAQEPYRSARRVFWVLDNGSSHRGQACIRRFQKQWPTIVPVHLPIHASWLNQVEIYFSVVQRKVLTPNDFDSLDEVAHRLLSFQKRYEQIAKPFEWKFTRDDLNSLMDRVSKREKAA